MREFFGARTLAEDVGAANICELAISLGLRNNVSPLGARTLVVMRQTELQHGRRVTVGIYKILFNAITRDW